MSERDEFARASERMSRWFIPRTREGWIAFALFFVIAIPLASVLNIWLAFACGWVGQVIFFFGLRCWREGLPWR